MAAAWCIALCVLTFLLGLLIGAALELPGWSTTVTIIGLTTLLTVGAMTVLHVTPFATVASIGRGYLPPVGFMFLTLFCSQIIAALGYGHYFPWSVPALLAGVAGPERAQPGTPGYTLVILVGVGAVLATAAWWKYARPRSMNRTSGHSQRGR